MTQPAPRGPLAAWSGSEKRWLVLLLVGATALRLWCWQGLGYMDSTNYANASMRLLHEGMARNLGFHQTDRLGMLAPPAVCLELLGRSEFAAVAYFLAISIAELVLIPLLLARIVAPRTALVATAIFAIAPLAVRDATSNGADNAMSVWANLAMLLLIAAPAAQRLRWYAAGGFLLGLACLHKETGLLLLPVAGAITLFAERDGLSPAVKRGAAGLLGFAVPMLVEAYLFRRWTGDALYRYHSIEGTHGPSLARMEQAGALTRYFVYWPSNMLGSPQNFGVLVFLLPGALVLLVRDRLRSLGWPVALWFAFPALYTVFGTSVLSAWRPVLPYPRYLHFVLLPGSVLAAEAFAGRVGRTASAGLRRAAIALAAALLVTACLLNARGWESAAAGVSAVLFAAAALRPKPPRLRLLAATLLLLPATMALERALGRTRPDLDPERRALEFVHELGVPEIVSTSPTSRALALLSDLGEVPVPVTTTPNEQIESAVPGSVLIVSDLVAQRNARTRDSTGAPVLYELARFPEDGDGRIRVLLRRGSPPR